MKKSTILRLAGLVALVAAIAAMLIFLPVVKDSLGAFFDWARSHRDLGAAALAAAYTPACLFFIPGSLLTLGGGFAFGVVRGTIAVSIGSVVGASAAFLVGRYLARGLIEPKVAANPKFRAIDQAVAEQGFKIVLLLRLSPAFPFNLLNYALGLTKVSFRDYVLASWIGMLPATFMYVYLGSTLGDLAEVFAGKVEGGIGQKVLLGVGLLATIVVTVFVARVAKRALDKAVPATPTAASNPQTPVTGDVGQTETAALRVQRS